MLPFITTLAFLAVSASPDYQKLADDAKWEWKADKATAEYSAKNLPKDYKAEVTEDTMRGYAASVRFTKEGKYLYTLDGHPATVFVVKDGILYYADYIRGTHECSLIARDLANGKQLWKAPLKGLGPISHFRYRNAVSLEFVEGALRVLSHESSGDYIEFVEMKEGKTVGNKVFKR